jgi:hypothetical protein
MGRTGVLLKARAGRWWYASGGEPAPSVLGEGFWSYLVMRVVPFLLIGALSAWLYRIGLPPDGNTAPSRKQPGTGP